MSAKRNVPSWQKARKRGHRAPRDVKRQHMDAPRTPGLSLLLWSVNGEPITSFQVVQTGYPSHVDFGGLRYDLVGSPDLSRKIAHYQTRTIVPKSAVA